MSAATPNSDPAAAQSLAVRMRPCVAEAKELLAEGRAKLRQQHERGSPGIQVCTLFAALLDKVVLLIYEAAMSELPDDDRPRLAGKVALIAHGGYGRRDVAPFSDVDLMLLVHDSAQEPIKPIARRLVMDLGDSGLELGFSVRTVSQACQLARQDATIFSALSESRFLGGDQDLFDRFQARFRRQALRHSRSLIDAVDTSRRQERAKFGETVFLLEPNIKRSRGGLRDIQLLRWVGFARYGESDPDALARLGVLSPADRRRLRKATEYLLHLRNELHFSAGRSYDVLHRAEQVRLAPLYGFPERDGLLPVEQFMQEYFRHTVAVRDIVGNFVAAARPRSVVAQMAVPLLSHQVEGDFWVGPKQISATQRGLQKLHGDITEVLRLMELANLYDKRIDDHTWNEIRRAMTDEPPTEPSGEGKRRFVSLMDRPARLGDLLRRLHELGVLERLVPGMSHARCLLQFNDYHKYTVDEHCLRAVEAATDFQHDPGPLGEAYRAIHTKRTLHLALLLHDLGKGFVEDHSEVGLRLAGQAAEWLRLPDREADTIKFLVHKHLRMSHLAFRRDLEDESVVVRFAVEVGSPERLQMLYVLTACDLQAVGPGVLNDWKIEVLTDLYQRAMRHLAGDLPAPDADRRAKSRREALKKILDPEDSDHWYQRQIDQLPLAFLQSADPPTLAEGLRMLHRLGPNDATAWVRYLPERGVAEYTVGTYESISPGIFHRLTGALSSQGLQILSADIHTLADGLVCDRFFVTDPDFAGPPSEDRKETVRKRLIESLRDTASRPPAFRRTWQSPEQRASQALSPLTTQVRVDNNTSERFTILDVFTHDRLGLLYTITKTLFDLRLSVSIAKIGTYLDQVVDVFYVTDEAGQKIDDETRLQQIREKLLAAIDERNPA